MSTKIRPLGTNVLIKQAAAESLSPGGLYIPAVGQKKINKGEVLAVGRGKFTNNGVLVDCECQVGDTVYWDEYQGTEVTLDNEKFWLVREDVISGRISPLAEDVVAV